MTGTALLVGRLAGRDVRRHATQAVLLVVAVASATATLTMALAMSGSTARAPYAATRAATRGPDAVAYLTSTSQAAALVGRAGVAAHSGPFPVASAVIGFRGRVADAWAEGRSTAPARLDQPLLTAGRWVRPGAVVVERTFAEALGVSVGDRVELDGKSFPVAGIAVTAAQAPYPNLCNGTATGPNAASSSFSTACPQSFAIPFLSLPGHGGLSSADDVGQIWTTEADAVALTSAADPLTTYALDLRLTHPDDAAAFVYRAATTPSLSALTFASWEGVEQQDARLLHDGRSVLQGGTLLLALLAVASVAVLVGRRLSEYASRVGLLKAVGGTPGVVAATFLAENLALAVLAAVLGLVAGWLASPLLTSPGTALVGAPGAPPISLRAGAEVVALAVVVALAATVVPAVKAARTSTVAALNDVARAPRRRGALVRLSGRLPVPVLFGVRVMARRPRRALLNTATIAITVTGVVAVIAFHAEADSKLSSSSALVAGGLSNPVINRDEAMLSVVTVLLVTLAALNALFTTWATVLDARRASALMLALGARVRQVSTGLVVAQVLSALPGVVLGIPLGLGLYKAAVHGGTLPPPAWLVVAALGVVVAVAALTVVPARIGTRTPVTDVLQAEAA